MADAGLFTSDGGEGSLKRLLLRRNPDGARIATAKRERAYGCLGVYSQAERRPITQGCGLATGIPRFLRAAVFD